MGLPVLDLPLRLTPDRRTGRHRLHWLRFWRADRVGWSRDAGPRDPIDTITTPRERLHEARLARYYAAWHWRQSARGD